MSKYDAIVIGAGHNGLTTAALLAKQGKNVLVLEKSDHVGGLAASEEFHPGFRTAGVLHDTTGLRRAAMDVLQLEKHGLEIANDHGSVFVPQEEGEGPGFLLHHDPHKATDELVEHSRKDAESYLGYREFIEKVKPLVSKLFDNKPPQAVVGNFSFDFSLLQTAVSLRLMGRSDMNEVLRIGPMCVADWLNEWFETNPVKTALVGPAIDCSFTGPWSPGSNANLVLWEALKNKPVKGGAHKIAEALRSACDALGVEIRTGAEVSLIRIQDDKVQGVKLKSGDEIDSEVVAASCDPKTTFLKLIPGRHSTMQMDHQVGNIRARGTTVKMNLAIRDDLEFTCRKGRRFDRIRTGKDLDSIERAFDAVKYSEFSEAPMLDIFVPSMQDETLAPKGHHVVSMLAHYAPYEVKGGWTDENREKLRSNILNTLETYAPGVKDQILSSELLTPVDLEKRYGVTGGHLYHGEHALDQFLTRPTARLSQYKAETEGLYLCGSGSHPGGGMTCAPGLLAAAEILDR